MTADDARVWSERSRNGRLQWWAWQVRRPGHLNGWETGVCETWQGAMDAVAAARVEIEEAA